MLFLTIASGIFMLSAVMILGEKISLFAYVGVLGILLFAFIGLKRELYGLLILLFIFYLFPYSSIDPVARRIGNYYTLYSRFSIFFSPWDYLVFAMIFIWGYKRIEKNRIKFRWIEHREIKLYTGLMVFALINGFLHVSGSFLSYGPTRFIQPIAAFLPFLYFIVMYLFTINFIESKKDVERCTTFLYLMNFVMIIYGIVRLIGILSGSINTLWGFGLPIIIYEQSTLLLYTVFLYLSFVLVKGKHTQRSFLLTLIVLFIVLFTTRRYNYILLISGVIAVFFFTWTTGNIKIPGILNNAFKALILVAVLVMILFLIFPGFIQGVSDSLTSILFLTEYGLQFGGDTRKAEMINTFLNMDTREYTYLTGFGLGTMWKEISYVPLDPLAFSEVQLGHSKSWFPSFHIPYFNKIFRFGIMGIVIFIIMLFLYIKRSIRLIKKVPDNLFYKAHLIALSSYLATNLFDCGDSFNPTKLIFCGFLFGVQSCIHRYCIDSENNS
ncbi:MAG: hypothetical protein GY863_00370 [bacterium]|nr:hypothetical protein [bacterium]